MVGSMRMKTNSVGLHDLWGRRSLVSDTVQGVRFARQLSSIPFLVVFAGSIVQLDIYVGRELLRPSIL